MQKLLIVFTIRDYKLEDQNNLVRLYQSVFAEPPWNEQWTEEQVCEDLQFAQKQKNPIIVVASLENRLLGFSWGYDLPIDKFQFLRGYVNPDANYMDEIAVEQNSRRKGIATEITISYLLEVKSSQVILRTDRRNKASMALFKNFGFKPVKDKDNNDVYDPKFKERIYLKK